MYTVVKFEIDQNAEITLIFEFALKLAKINFWDAHK